MSRSFVLVALLFAFCFAQAQVPVPFTSNTERFMVFHRGSFHEVEPRPPKSVFAMEGQVMYVDHDGHLKMYDPESDRMHLLDRDPGTDIRATRQRIVWHVHDTLKTERDGRAVPIMDRVQHYEVTDSLVVYIDSTLHQLGVLWKGRSHTLADVLPGSERPQWMQGSNTVAFFNKEARKVLYFHRGKVEVLCDSTDVGIVATGGDVIGYWDGNSKRFMAMYKGATLFLSDLRPLNAQAGEGMLAFVDGNGRLKCFQDGMVHTVSDEVPSAYWVKDRVLIYLDQGRFKLFRPEGSVLVEQYVPERWKVEGNMLVYLDINREVRGVRNGERVRFGSEANVATFDLFGDHVVHRNMVGNTVIATPKRTWAY